MGANHCNNIRQSRQGEEFQELQRGVCGVSLAIPSHERCADVTHEGNNTRKVEQNHS